MAYLIPKHPALRSGIAFAAPSLIVGRELGYTRIRACTIRWDLSQADHGVWFFDPEASLDPGIQDVKLTLRTPGDGTPSWRVDAEGIAHLTVVLEEFELSADSWIPLRKSVRWSARAVVGESDGLGWWGGGAFDAGDGFPLSLSIEFDSASTAVGACPRKYFRDKILERVHSRLERNLDMMLSPKRP